MSWSVSPAMGMIGAGGLYTAPAKVSAPTAITVKATSLVDSTKFGTVSITVTP